jgi:prevent-host-death family protein
MTQMTAGEARTRFAEVLDSASHGDEVVVTRNGREQAVVISIEDYRRFLALEEAADLRMIDERLASPPASYASLEDVVAETMARSE